MIKISSITIPREPDVVTILWFRNPLRPGSPRTKLEAKVIGSARPCRNLLRTNDRLAPARRCLLENGFTLDFEEDIGIFGVSLFVRQF